MSDDSPPFEQYRGDGYAGAFGPYLADPATTTAVNTALAAQMPLLLTGEPPDEVVTAESVARVAAHRDVTLTPFALVRSGLAGHAPAKWQAWRRKQGLAGRIPASLGEVLEAIDGATVRLLQLANGGA